MQAKKCNVIRETRPVEQVRKSGFERFGEVWGGGGG